MAVEELFSKPETLENPYDYYDAIRAERQIFFSQALQAYFVTRQTDADQILMNPRVFSSSPVASTHGMANFLDTYHPIYEEAGTPPPMQTLVTTDGQLHRRYRAAVEQAFGGMAVRKLEPVIDAIIDELIDGFIDEGHTDIYVSFCLKLPLIIMCLMVGLPREDAHFLKQGADAAAGLALAALETEERRVELHKNLCKLHVYLQEYIKRYRAEPADNLMSELIHMTPGDGVPFTDQELISLFTVINVGGNETTTNGLGSVFSQCFLHPELQARLRETPEEIPKFVEEALRFESPVATMPRWVVEDTWVGETLLPAGSCVQMSFASINRDPAAFGCPAHLNLDRASNRHMAFGKGVHYCLGARLARAELALALRRILERMDDIRIVDDGKPLLHDPKLIVRALRALPISFSRR